MEALVSVGEENVNLEYQKRLAIANGITDYTYSAEQNIQMLNLLKQGLLLDPEGTILTGWQTLTGNNRYYYDANGVRQYGWLELDGNMYYLDPTTGVMTTGTKTIDGKEYIFDDNGVCTNYGACSHHYVDGICTSCGAAAQSYYKYNVTDLANGQLPEAQKAYGTAELTEITDIRVKGANYLGTRLELGSSIGMQMNFVGTTADMYAVIQFTNHAGKKISERVAPTEISGNYLINITQVAVADGRMPITVTVYNADGSIHGYATDSMTSYIARMSNADSLYENIMKFSDSAYAYLH